MIQKRVATCDLNDISLMRVFCTPILQLFYKLQQPSETSPILDKPAFSRIPLNSEPRIYAPQTKILEGRKNRPERLFDALSNVS